MPPANHFRHQSYLPELADVPVEFLDVEPPLSTASDAFGQRMAAVGRQLREAGVAGVILVHGTFVGSDAMGLARKLTRVVPSAGHAFGDMQKKWLDRVAGDVGNFAERYATELQAALAVNGSGPVVRRFHWSSENHHIGRAAAAVQLLDELQQLDVEGERLLLCGHSHGGNVFALVTNLLGADAATRDAFFEAARPYYQTPWGRGDDLPVWSKVREQFQRSSLQDRWKLDLVTLGTPVRYGWDTNGYSQLLHIINHRPLPGLPRHLGKLPEVREEVMEARGGDYVQLLAVAGTNFAPGGFAFRARRADQRLNRLLQQGQRKRDLLKRWKTGVRVPDEGHTLLIDYGEYAGGFGEHLAGHAVYTRRDWMCFHMEQIASRFYS